MDTIKDWKCPFCKGKLSQVGILEVYQGVEEWTKYAVDKVKNQWDVIDNGSDDGSHHYLACGGCQNILPYEIYEEIYNEILN